MVNPSDDRELEPPTKTETTVRQFDAEGKLLSETVTVVTQRHRQRPAIGFAAPPEPPTTEGITAA